MAMPPISPSDNSSVWPNFLATACRTSTAALVTSTPIPSPGRIRIFRFIICLILAGARGFALFEHLAREGGDFVVPHAFFAIRHGGETVVNGVELLTAEIETQVFAPLGERVPPAVLAENQLAFGDTDAVRVNDLIGGSFLQKTVLMDAGFVGESVLADDGLVGLRSES